LLVEEELARAIRVESSLAIQFWWGVSQHLVWVWRKALGVPRYTEGSLRLQRMNAEAGADVVRGVPLSPKAVERRRQTAIELDLAQYMLPCSRPGGSRPWSNDELALLGTMPDAKLARRLKRTRDSVRQAREKRDIAPPDSQRPRWTEGEDELLRTLPAPEVVRRTGRTLAAIYCRRRELELPDGRRHNGRRRS
jgi:hypothetical protein